MKWKIRIPNNLGEPMRKKDWLRLSEAIQAFKNDLAYNHPVNISCEEVDVDIDKLTEAALVAKRYYDR